MVLWVGDQMKWVATVTGGANSTYAELSINPGNI